MNVPCRIVAESR